MVEEIPQKKKKWCKNWLQNRNQFSHMKLLRELEVNVPEDYVNYARMDHQCFVYLLNKIKAKITRQDTHFRQAISAEERLMATLRFLATGRSYEDLKFSTRISPQSLCKIIPETCEAIYSALRDEFLKFPQSEEEWKEKAQEFMALWNFPHCLGAMDGKHVAIRPPPGSGSLYYNYKKFHSLVLMAIVDANYNFLLVDIGTNGRISDGGVLQQTYFYELLDEKKLNIPRPERLVIGKDTIYPYVFVADDAFPMKQEIMKPFKPPSGQFLTREQSTFNYRLSRARRVVENAFGILSNRFQILQTTIALPPETVEMIVLACCSLHNYLRRNAKQSYLPPGLVDQENLVSGNLVRGSWRNDPQLPSLDSSNPTQNYSNDAKRVRELYMTYFMEDGKVPWQ
uniref:Uncharacterized protein n=1 Tax=Phlebotomus papatasi TaxID=29031 RepID=A0A1B0GMF1_PHLPP